MRGFFLGCFQRSVSKDGRVAFPTEFRDGSEDGKWFLIPPFAGGEGLILVPSGRFNEEITRLQTDAAESRTDELAALRRSVLVEIDRQGNLLIPGELLAFIGLGEDREVAFVGEMANIRLVGKRGKADRTL